MAVSNLILIIFLSFALPCMDFKHNIIQWNCRGLKPKFDEISLLLSQQKPSVFCLQETFLKPDDKITLKGLTSIIIYILTARDLLAVVLFLLNLLVHNEIYS